MLPGPAPQNDYFDTVNVVRTVTPHESSLRSGLTPGGLSGALGMPGTPLGTSYLLSGANGASTPGGTSLEMHRLRSNLQHSTQAPTQPAATSASASTGAATASAGGNGPTSNPGEVGQSTAGNMSPPKTIPQSSTAASAAHMDPFTQHDATDAANGLFMLAKSGAQQHSQSQQQNNGGSNGHGVGATAAPSFTVPGSAVSQQQHGMFDGGASSPTDDGIHGGIASPNDSVSDDGLEKASVSRRGSKKKSSTTTAGARRKAEDSGNKQHKRSKTNSGGVNAGAGSPGFEDEFLKNSPGPSNGRNGNGSISGSVSGKDSQSNNGSSKQKPSEEERRKNFLERNRIAALKCRQRKKQWLQGIQEKNEIYASENELLNTTVRNLRHEVCALKVMLLAHADCPTTQAQQQHQQIATGGIP
ncbi:hypothetical protein KEM55_008301, partial [Ascosphaera atra]